MRSLRVILFALVIANFFALAQEPAASPQSAATQSKATVYVYRYKQFVGSALAPSVYCDEVQLARMDNGRYFSVRLDPGQHAFRSNDTQSGVQLELKPGQDYFIRVEIATGLMKGHGRLILMSAEQGRYELLSSKLKPLDAGKVADKTRVSVEEAKFEAPGKARATATPQAALQGGQPAALQTVSAHPASPEQTVTGVTLSDGAPDAADQMSLGDAARKTRQKKAAKDSAAPPQ